MIRKGTKVTWKWGSGKAEGTVQSTSINDVSKTIKGTKITRHGAKNNKALYIKQSDGDFVLKLESEVERMKKK